MNELSNSQLALQNATQEDPVQKKIAMDALRKRIAGEPDKEKKLREACEGFEAIFIQKVWEQMRKSVPKEGYLHSKDEETYQSMFDQELAKKMSSAGGIGLADMMYEQLSQKLGESSRSTTPSRLAIDPNLTNLERPFVPAALNEHKQIRPLDQSPGARNMASAADMYQPFSYPDEAQTETTAGTAPKDSQDIASVSAVETPDQANTLTSLERVPDNQAEVARYFDALEQSVRAEAARRAAAQGSAPEDVAAGRTPLAEMMYRDIITAARFIQETSDKNAPLSSSVTKVDVQPTQAPVPTQAPLSAQAPVAASSQPSAATVSPESSNSVDMPAVTPVAAINSEPATPPAISEVVENTASLKPSASDIPVQAAPQAGVPFARAYSARTAAQSRLSGQTSTPTENIFSQDQLTSNISLSGKDISGVVREFSGPSLEEQRALAAVALAEKMNSQTS